MSSEFSEKYSYRFRMIHRFIYATFIVFFLILFISGLNKSGFLTLYFIISAVLFLVTDEYFFKKNYAISVKYYEYKTFIELAILSCGLFKDTDSMLVYIAVLLLQLFLFFEYVVFNDIFYESQLTNKRLIGTVLVIFGLIAFNWGEFSTEWILVFFIAAVLLFAVMMNITDYYVKSIVEYNYKLTSLYFTNESIEEDNKALLEYQEKVKSVNNELNLQRINLAKLNKDLEDSANEMRALVDVMKDFSSNFDVKKSMEVLIDKIYETKGVDMVSFYIDKGVFKNKKPAICTKGKEEDKEFFESIMKDMYDILKEDNVLQPVVLSGASVLRHEYFKDKAYTEVVLFPAFENDDVYGVMLCASKKVDFFYKGYAFYESALIDFSSVLKSTKLYIQMEDMANIDSLTGLYNRLNFNNTFPILCKKAVEDNEPFAVAMIDVDKFKDINDTYGHLAGDKVLKTIGSILNEYSNANAGTAVRYGGEEFLVILPGKQEEEAYEILTEIHDKIASTAIDHSGKIIRVNTSIGLAIYPDTCKDINRIVDAADETMYYSKNHGRGMLLVNGKEVMYASKYLKLEE